MRDGLVLIGDAAHTHGSIGAQGINLALQDAAALHPVLLDALFAGQPTRERWRPVPGCAPRPRHRSTGCSACRRRPCSAAATP
ncbi:FAD-dependent monooxygenase [Streptomyces sp. NPDC102437]|uniref:FAD-dependent monooxygenase n=1 Tax=Streptomyces sp. NPDC102437 TaxID=3366175 RepID=UPI003815EEC5